MIRRKPKCRPEDHKAKQAVEVRLDLIERRVNNLEKRLNVTMVRAKDVTSG